RRIPRRAFRRAAARAAGGRKNAKARPAPLRDGAEPLEATYGLTATTVAVLADLVAEDAAANRAGNRAERAAARHCVADRRAADRADGGALVSARHVAAGAQGARGDQNCGNLQRRIHQDLLSSVAECPTNAACSCPATRVPSA